MGDFLKGFLELLEYADEHDGILAMLGIAVTIIIFRREVANNFYTLEKENFNKVFEPAYKIIPQKIKQLENAGIEQWNQCFEELLGEFSKMLDGANYFRYTMPYLYKLIEMYVDEIEDLSRHDNWRLYRCSERQLQLVTKKSRRIIRSIDNASKGKVFIIKLSGLKWIRKIKDVVMRLIVDQPYDRIASQVKKLSCYEAVTFNDTRGEIYSEEELDRLKWGHIQICSKTGYNVVKVVPIQKTGIVRFGYSFNFRIGRRIGRITIKTPKDRSVKIRQLHHTVKLDLVDTWAHKLVIIWKKEDDNCLYYDVVKIRRYIA